MEQKERREYLINTLLGEQSEYGGIAVPTDEGEQRRLLRALMNVRPPKAASSEFLGILDEYLAEVSKQKGVTDCRSIPPKKDGMCVWQGDITTLKCDAIVNAANSGLTGCYVPNHRCIDNCIHTYSGIRLRLECAELMRMQGHEEPTGSAKLTSAYSLPCRYIIHTVGPIVSGRLTEKHCRELSDCYRSCLELAADNGLESVAFCCISTGEFHFPNDRAAAIAVDTVSGFMKKNTSVRRVIFNVFKDIDRELYEKLLR